MKKIPMSLLRIFLPIMFRQMKIVGISVPFVFGRMTRSLLLITNQATLIME